VDLRERGGFRIAWNYSVLRIGSGGSGGQSCTSPNSVSFPHDTYFDQSSHSSRTWWLALLILVLGCAEQPRCLSVCGFLA
jgi:hypothetical protein